MNNKRGAALMQVLLITVVLAGMAVMLLRVTLSRTSSSRITRRSVAAEQAIQSCMAEVNSLWAYKTPEIFARDLRGVAPDYKPIMYCKNPNQTPCEAPVDTYICRYPADENYLYEVTAEFKKREQVPNTDQYVWRLVYTITDSKVF